MAGDDGSGGHTPKDFNECVSQEQLDDAKREMHEVITKAVTEAIIGLKLGEILSTVTDRIDALETRQQHNQDEDIVYDDQGNIDEAATREARLRRRLRRNTQGMGGTHNHNHNHQQGNQNRVPDDPYAKVKFTIPSFSGYYDADGYLDWEMTVEQKFSAHLVPEQHRVRQATSEFKDFAIVWWTGLIAEDAAPTTWNDLKSAMRDRFVPPSYHRDLRKKLMRLEQGDKTVQDYYGELQKGLMRCAIVEGTEDAICRFYSGLRRDIQDIVDYKEFHTVNQLFQFAMLAEKELQGRDLQSRSKATYTPRSAPSSGLTKPASFRSPPPASNKRPAASEAATTPKPSPARTSDSGKKLLQEPAKSSSSVSSTGGTTVQCHRCHGFGHVRKD